MGGAHHTADQIQENRIPAVAHLASNLMFPKGLHTTTHLSQEMIVSDQSAVMPVWREINTQITACHFKIGEV